MKLFWVIFLFATSVLVNNCLSTKLKIGKKNQNQSNWNFKVQSLEDTKLQKNGSSLQKRETTLMVSLTVIAAIAAVSSTLVAVLSEIGNHSPKIAIGIANKTPYKWKDIDIGFDTGTSDKHVPDEVNPKKALIYGAYAERLSPNGAAGVIAVHIPSDDVTLCVLFSVPYNKLSYKNWWNVKSFSGKVKANQDPCTFEKLYYEFDPLEGDDSRKTTHMEFYYSAEGTMSSGKSCKLNLNIMRKVEPGTAVSAPTVVKAIPAVLAEIGDYSNKISIGIINETPYEWERLNKHFSSGTTDAPFPDKVPKGKGFNYPARKDSALTGPYGVIALYIPDDDISLCFLFSVPYSRARSNWWNVKSFSGEVKANEGPCNFDDLYEFDPLQGDGKRKTTYMEFYYSAEGEMSSSSKCTLELYIRKKVAPGTAVSAATVVKAIPAVLEEIGDYSNKISIGIINETPYEWEHLNVYFSDGTSDVTLPDHVPKDKGFNYPAKDGTAGLIALYIKKLNKTLHVFFRVSSSKAKWNLEIHSGKKNADETWYYNLNKANPREGDDTVTKHYGKAKGTMSRSERGWMLKLQIISKSVHYA